MNSLIDLFNIFRADAMKLELEENSSLVNSFSDGRLDGQNDFEPIADRWFNSDYRRDYWLEVLNRTDIKSALIYGIETDKVMILT